jgi:hypothetical protein
MRKMPLSGARIKYPYLWLSLILFLLTSIGILSSRAQSLFLTNTAKTVRVKPDNPLLEKSVYGPLARSAHFRNLPSSPEKTAAADSLTVLEPDFSWSGWSDVEWWIPEDQDPDSEAPWRREGARHGSPGRFSYQDLFPRLENRDIDPQAVMSNFITMGVVDLLDDLSEQEAEGVAEQDSTAANPFDKALKEVANEEEEGTSESEVEPAKAEKTADSDQGNSESSSNEETNSNASDTEEAGNANETIKGSPPLDRELLFIGSFGGQPLATAIGTVQADLLHQSLNHTVFIDLEGAGKQNLDMDLVLRDFSSQQSVAFGDLDGNGSIDMVVTSLSTHRAHLLKSDAQGNYGAAGEIFAGSDPSAAVIGDFNSDGLADVAVGNQDDRKIVVDGKGLRRLSLLPTSRVDGAFTSMTPYDFDSDGLMDLLLSNYQDFTASIYLNRKNGLFAESDSFALQELPYLQSHVDLDSDGINDHVYILALGDNISVIMINGRNGTISNLGNMTLDPSLYLVLGDFNMDRFVDIALAHRR